MRLDQLEWKPIPPGLSCSITKVPYVSQAQPGNGIFVYADRYNQQFHIGRYNEYWSAVGAIEAQAILYELLKE